MFDGKVALHLDVLAKALDGLDVEVVQRGAAGDEVLARLLIAHRELHPFVAAQVIGDPGLAALVFAANPVAEELALVGVALPLEFLPST